MLDTFRAVYICPNNNLVQQTLGQAKRFGIRCCTAEEDIPEAFTDGEQILITTVQKLFNGLTKFRLGPHSLPVGALVMDDCHACIDSIQDRMKITLPRNHGAYQALLALFASDLKDQGSGTYAEIEQGDYGSFLSVPYWSWTAHQNSIAALLAKHAKTDEVKYAWPLVKDALQHCTCIVSGASIEIDPHLPPLEHFGSYANAKHRVFMSATVTNDAFLVKGLGLSSATITEPLVDKHEHWSGEKMILLPNETKDILAGALLRAGEKLVSPLHNARMNVSPEGSRRYLVRQLEYDGSRFPSRDARELTENVLVADDAGANPEFPYARKQKFLDNLKIIVQKAIEGISIPLHGLPVRPP